MYSRPSRTSAALIERIECADDIQQTESNECAAMCSKQAESNERTAMYSRPSHTGVPPSQTSAPRTMRRGVCAAMQKKAESNECAAMYKQVESNECAAMQK